MSFIHRYLFLGDSYTCCEKEDVDANKWPLQLAAKIGVKNIEQLAINCERREDGENGTQWISDFELREKNNTKIYAKLKIIAKSGRRTDELLDAIKREKLFLANQSEMLTDYDAVFILIGVNDQYQRSEDGIESFKISFKQILIEAISAVKNNDYSKICVLSIPDWSTTPAGKNDETHKYRMNRYQLDKLSTQYTVYNEVLLYNLTVKSIIDEFNRGSHSIINFIPNIEKITREFGFFQEMTKADGLHYNWAMTKKWNDEIFLSMRFLT